MVAIPETEAHLVTGIHPSIVDQYRRGSAPASTASANDTIVHATIHRNRRVRRTWEE